MFRAHVLETCRGLK